MEKDFEGWNTRKKQLQRQQPERYFHERELWMCSLGVNIGSEQDGVHRVFERPVLILKRFNNDTLLCVPLTRTRKKNKYFVALQQDDGNSFVVLSQIRLISSKRLRRKMRMISLEEFMTIMNQISRFFTDI